MIIIHSLIIDSESIIKELAISSRVVFPPPCSGMDDAVQVSPYLCLRLQIIE